MWTVSRKLYMMPEIQQINRLEMHGAEIPFPDESSASERSYEKSCFYRSLDGTWKFKLFHRPEDVPAGIESGKYAAWDKIRVPSNWTLGNFFDKPVYTNVKMPFPNNPPMVPEENPTGIYRTTFKLPANWKNRRVVLHVGGAESYLEVFLNGKFIGMGKDTRLPSEFDLTEAVEYQKENVLVCRVIRWSDSSYVEDQDQWWMAGIYRSVWLYSTDDVWMEDLAVAGDLDLKNGKGLLSVRTHLAFSLKEWGPGAQDRHRDRKGNGPEKPYTVHSVLQDASGKTIWSGDAEIPPCFRDGGYRSEQQTAIPKVHPWSSEDPYLYTLLVSLLDDKGSCVECRSKRIGFRNVKIVGRDLLFNGKRVLIRGINRHEHSMKNGKTLSLDEMLQDIRMMKQFNFNAVRTCHYPDDHRWYDLCDEYGLYVLDEANFEAHANYATLCRDPRWTNSIVERARRLVLRDRSHTCIYAWSLGNESGNGENHQKQIAAIKALDPVRLIHHEGEIKRLWGQGSGNVLTGGTKHDNEFYNPMYEPIAILRQYSGDKKTDRPAIPCEYAHAMGNSSGSLSDYWDLFKTSPGIQGGFIWDWIDQGLLTKDAKGRTMLAYGGDFGEKDHDFDFCCNGMIAADHRVHPAMYEFRHLVQPVTFTVSDAKKMTFRIRNERDFTTLKDIAGVWSLEINGQKEASGMLPDLSRLAPGKEMTFPLPVKIHPVLRGDEVFVNAEFFLKEDTAWAESGTLLAHDQADVTKAFPKTAKQPEKAPVRTEMKTLRNEYRLISGETVLSVQRKDGKIQLKKASGERLAQDFLCNFFRAATDNDGIRGWVGQEWKPAGKWLAAGLDKLKERSCRVTADDGRITIEKSFSGKDPKARAVFRQTLALKKDGSFAFVQSYDLPESWPTMPRIGVIASADAAFETFEWFGRGPWENYTDRCRSAMVGRYESTATENLEDTYILPQENGNHTDTRELLLKSDSGTVLRFTAEKNFEFGVSHFTPDDLYHAFHQCELSPRKETIFTLDLAQRGIGTGSCGPQTLKQYELDEKHYDFRFTLEVL